MGTSTASCRCSVDLRCDCVQTVQQSCVLYLWCGIVYTRPIGLEQCCRERELAVTIRSITHQLLLPLDLPVTVPKQTLKPPELAPVPAQQPHQYLQVGLRAPRP